MARFAKYALAALFVGFLSGFLGEFAIDLGFNESKVQWWRGYVVGAFAMFAAFSLWPITPRQNTLTGG